MATDFTSARIANPFGLSVPSSAPAAPTPNAFTEAGIANPFGLSSPSQTTAADPTKVPGDDGTKKPVTPTSEKYLVTTVDVNELGGKIQTYNVWSDGTRTPIGDARVDMSAGEAAADMFRAAGLDEAFVNSLMDTIKGVYAANVAPTTGQIKTAINTSQAYKTRFKGNEVVRQRMANGQGRPGDQLLSPAEYIALENTYRTIFADAEMPAGYYDNVDDFANLIGNGVSAAELKSRVDTAGSALREADTSTLNTLQQYYNLSQGDLVAYLLDPTRAMPILEGRQTQGQYGLNSREELQRQYAVAQVGGAAARQGMEAGQALSEEIVQQGKGQYAEQAFSQAGAENENVKRLGSLYGEPLDFKDMVKETLSLTGGVESGKKRRKFASKERAAFGGQSALDKSSLSRRQDV
jgi:hypothetical protein